uniref:ATP-dependent DNA helicase n=1 Tax=Caenorhabditis japonica TaxID=281687 RepID=A0A8R1I7Y8_CAEJA
MTTEFLNSVWTSSLPHRLCLKVGSVVVLLRNLDVSSGICNGTCLIIKELQRKCILCTFATGSNKGKDTFVPRITCREHSSRSSWHLPSASTKHRDNRLEEFDSFK